MFIGPDSVRTSIKYAPKVQWANDVWIWRFMFIHRPIKQFLRLDTHMGSASKTKLPRNSTKNRRRRLSASRRGQPWSCPRPRLSLSTATARAVHGQCTRDMIPLRNQCHSFIQHFSTELCANITISSVQISYNKTYWNSVSCIPYIQLKYRVYIHTSYVLQIISNLSKQ